MKDTYFAATWLKMWLKVSLVKQDKGQRLFSLHPARQE
jgi:hypothetical protein